MRWHLVADDVGAVADLIVLVVVVVNDVICLAVQLHCLVGLLILLLYPFYICRCRCGCIKLHSEHHEHRDGCSKKKERRKEEKKERRK